MRKSSAEHLDSSSVTEKARFNEEKEDFAHASPLALLSVGCSPQDSTNKCEKSDLVADNLQCPTIVTGEVNMAFSKDEDNAKESEPQYELDPIGLAEQQMANVDRTINVTTVKTSRYSMRSLVLSKLP
ncbi:unnamed protein product [Didymodactylos carnosus]|uniref:Uncharacterized protein n=1 Tax=Didymodactylos carnosus TaxID=1234261 RepID=A0A815T586_9BILA|nr:unnamed protein product [Didymodactylos carnosus]CAF4362413.1 unnamed protein product [Didymodactylos carnosus]